MFTSCLRSRCTLDTHSTVSPNPSMSCFVMLSFWIRALASGNRRDWDWVHSNFPMKHSALLFLIPSQIPILYLEFTLIIESVGNGLANTLSPNGRNSCDFFLVMQSLECCSPVSTFLTPGQDDTCVFHQPRKMGESFLSSCCVLATSVIFTFLPHDL